MTRSWKISCLVAFAIAVILWSLSSLGSQGRFSPFSLKTQHRDYIGASIAGTFWQDKPNTLVDYLIDKGYVAPVSNEPHRWDSLYHFNTSWRDGMGRAYHAFGTNRHRIIEWAAKHPKLARIVFAEGFKLIRSQEGIEVNIGYYLLSSARFYESPKGLLEFLRSVEKDYQDHGFEFDPEFIAELKRDIR